MGNSVRHRKLIRSDFYFVAKVVVVLVLVLISGWKLANADNHESLVLKKVQSIELNGKIDGEPGGLSYSYEGEVFYLFETPAEQGSATGPPQIAQIDMYGRLVGSQRLPASLEKSINMAFIEGASQMLFYQPETREFVLVNMKSAPGQEQPDLKREPASEFGITDPHGIAINPENSQLYILDNSGPAIVSILPAPGPDNGNFERYREGRISRIDLSDFDLGALQGLAFNPANGYLYTLNPDSQVLYEIKDAEHTPVGFEIPALSLNQPQGMVFAPSGDRTDDPDNASLYIADSGTSKGITEYSLETMATTSESVPTVQSTLIQVIDASQFDPPSPDTAGIAYLSHQGTLLASDSEVNEIDSLFTGDNLFDISLSGTLLDTLSTTSYSNEPTGVAYNPANYHIFIADDNADKVNEVDPGPDGLYDTADDIVTSIDTAAFESGDPEGVAFDSWSGVLLIVDGVNREVYQVDPGPNGVFEGLSGDDIVTSFDTAGLGLDDPEGIGFSTDNGHIYAVGKPVDTVFEITTDGTLFQLMRTLRN